MATIALVSYVSSKLDHAAAAKDLYISPLFMKARAYAEQIADRWYVLSAEHHLLAPDQEVAPYEKTLNKMPKAEREQWARTVFSQITSITVPSDRIVFLSGLRYREGLAPLLSGRGNPIEVPMEGLSIGRQLQWLTRRLRSSNRGDLEDFYRLLDKLRAAEGGGRIIRDCTGRYDWPERGVYILFEQGEVRSASASVPRVVRIGTHMVSRGSKAILWNRLRTHRGYADGRGNHRASVFRRHVGDALIQRSHGTIDLTTWGQGQSATKEIQRQEESLEKKVSEYIGNMTILWLAIPGEAGPDSDRSFIEKNAIALLSSIGQQVDPPSDRWLGKHSPTPAIRDSGLWNVDYTAYNYDNRFLGVLSRYVDAMAGERKLPVRSIAPRDWYLADKGEVGRGQLFLFDEV